MHDIHIHVITAVASQCKGNFGSTTIPAGNFYFGFPSFYVTNQQINHAEVAMVITAIFI